MNLSISSCTFPERWKITRIVPVHKKGDSSLLSNYRPISIISNFAKLYEKVLYRDIYSCTRSSISTSQHGFLPGRSTVTNLATLSQVVGETLDKRGRVDVIYTDLSKAFDLIDHEILLLKLSSYGFVPSCMNLLRSYLYRRQCYVTYNGYSSSVFVPTSGVPQGSNLGPLLFVLFLNDLLLKFNCPILAYADDIKIYSEITSVEDSSLLQDNLDVLVRWCEDSKLKLNIDKCCVVIYTRSSTICNASYHMNGTYLNVVAEVKDLGVLFDSTLTFKAHVSEVCSAALRSLGFVMRVSRYFNDTRVLKSLYFSFVLSKIEYASLIWYPLYASDSIPLDRIHRRFLKYLTFKTTGDYPERGMAQDVLLAEHSMMSLRDRRDTICTKFVSKLVDNTIDCPFLLGRMDFLVPRINARHESTFRVPFARTNIMRRVPTYILANMANKHIDGEL